jgi:retron-type reverse transcriptase
MFLQSGVMIGERWQANEEGSPQGGVISPLIANIYLDAKSGVIWTANPI